MFSKKENFQKLGIAVAEGISIKCVYLISKNISERKAIGKDIVEIYKIRSSLVHGRKLFLDHKERAMLSKSRDFLERSNAREIELLRRE